MLSIKSKPDAPGAGRVSFIAPLLLKLTYFCEMLLNSPQKASFLAPLAFRLFLAPIFITFGFVNF